MDTARQALTLLRNELRGEDVKRLTPEERRQFREICHHWAEQARPVQPDSSKTAA